MTESIIGVLAWAVLALVAFVVVSFGVFGLILGGAPARHCEHGFETEKCGLCNGRWITTDVRSHNPANTKEAEEYHP